jgi:UDP-N-acetylglucosamine 2-epimerase
MLRGADAIIGNSSAGIIEAPALHIPAVNIGGRQEGRERGDNLIDVDYRRDAIRDAIEKALTDRAFREKVSRGGSPYGDGKAARRIVEILRSIDPATFPLQKRLTY